MLKKPYFVPLCLQRQCFHGMGHGHMLASNRDVTKSVQKCETTKNEQASRACINGVYMEFFLLTDHGGEISRTLSDVHITTCHDEQPIDKTDCYVYAPAPYLESNPNDYYNAAHTYCKRADTSRGVEVCQHGVGAQLIKDTIHSPRMSVDVCASFEKQVSQLCFSGAISGYYYNTNITNESEANCIEIFSQDYQHACSELIIEHL